MDRNAYEEKQFIEVTTRIISKYLRNVSCKYQRKFLAHKLFNLCRDYRKSSYIFKLLLKALEEDSCDWKFVDKFLGVCGRDLSRWVPPDGRTDAVGLLLELSCGVKDILEEKGFWSTRDFTPDRHPVNQNLFRGRTANVPLLLRYGQGLELTESFYVLLQFMVVDDMVPFHQNSVCYEKMMQLPDKKRVFLVLLVIWTFNKAERCPGAPMTDASRALRAIWRSIPDSHLCRREINEIFESVAVHSDKLQMIIEQYEKFVCEDDFGELPHPRSLAHHSRCRVRQSLGLRRLLPTGVDALPVPIEIKNYLLLE